MLRKKFFANSGTPSSPSVPGELYYKPIARIANAGAATVAGLQFTPALVISKCRNSGRDTALFDTKRGALKRLNVNTQQLEVTDTNTLIGFNAAGYSLGADTPAVVNSNSGDQFINWAFAKAAGFMDVQTYTGDGAAGKLVPHDLGVPPELVIVKSRSSAGLNWPTRTASVPGDLYANTVAAATAPAGNIVAATLASVPSINHAPAGVAMNGNVIISARGGTATADYSTNAGASWSVIPLPAIFGCIAYSPTLNLFVASSLYVGNGVFSSVDGVTWAQGVSADFIGSNINWCNDAFMSTNNGHIYKSVNGTTWTKITSPFPVTSGKGPWSYICYGNGVYVAVTLGDGGADKGSSNKCGAAYSTDGVTWLVADPTGTLVSAITYLNKIVYGNGVFVATGNGGFALRPNYNVINDVVNTNAAQSYYSVDGITWNPMGSFPVAGNWANLTFANGMFMAVSSNFYGTAQSYPSTASAPNTSTRAVIFSTDGATWQSGQLPSADFWSGLAYSTVTQRFYTVGNSGLTYSITTNSESANMYSFLAASVSLGASNQTNMSGQTYAMYLFASLPSISKVGTYIGNGGQQNIDCGFDTSARFILLKSVNASGNWGVWDTARGIAATGNSPVTFLDTATVEQAIPAITSFYKGFSVTQSVPSNCNATGITYLYMAIS